MTEKLRKLWKNNYFQMAVSVGLIILVVAGIFFGAKLVLSTDYPFLTVESGSMCVPYGGLCDGWSHPFDRTLHVGDVIVVQGVNPADLNVGDIIVFHSPFGGSDLIVHRIIAIENVTGTLKFITKGDGNNDPDSWLPFPASLVVGKVIGRIPWIGLITLFMKENSWGILLIILLMIIVLIIEFIIPLTKKTAKQSGNNAQLQMYL